MKTSGETFYFVMALYLEKNGFSSHGDCSNDSGEWVLSFNNIEVY